MTKVTARFASSVAAFAMSLFFGTARADTVYLVGAQVYASGADGTNVGAYSGPAYQYSTNSSTSHDWLDINSNTCCTGISIPLVNGANAFTFGQTQSFSIPIIGLELFFNTTGTSYNPPYQAGVGIPGDLAAYVGAGSSSFAIPAAGTDVQSYNTSALSVNSALYSGATSFTIDSERITITAFSATADPAGSFTLTETPVPEPGAAIPLAVCLLLLGPLAVRRFHRMDGRGALRR